MSKLKKLLNADIRYGCGDDAYNAGKHYFKEGHVLELKLISDGALFVQLNATVQGTANNPYKQNIRIIWRSDFSSAEINGNCSCPAAFNCKHVAAVCLKFNTPEPAAQKPASDFYCLQWLTNFQQPAVEPATDPNQEFVAYLLNNNPGKHEFSVDLQITKAKKSGGYNKGRKSNLSAIRYSFSHLNYIRPEDKEIAKLLTALNPFFKDEPLITGALGYLALTKLLASGRLFWENLERLPLQQGPSRALDFVWQLNNTNQYQLEINIGENSLLILTDPPMYLDLELDLIGTLNTCQLSYEQLKLALNAPPVPANYANEFSQKLLIEHANLPLPPPVTIKVQELEDLHPVPKLVLRGLANNPHQHLDVMAVAFIYGDWLLPAIHCNDKSVIKTEQGLLRIARNNEKEQTALDKLYALGFTRLDQCATELILYSPAEFSLMDSATRWSDFLEFSAAQLRGQGWIIETENSFLLSFETIANWDAEIISNHTDWFEMHFSINVDGQPVPLLPLIMPVLENYDLDDLPATLSLAMTNHKFLNIPSEKIKPFFAILLEIFSRSSLDRHGSLKVSRFNVASLADMETHSQGLFSFTGGEALRALAKKLQNFSGITEVVLPTNFRAQLRHYQQQGLNWLQFLREYQFSGILADDMGLGKTVQTLAHLLVEKQQGRMSKPSLIIAPTSLMSNWRREAERFTPDLNLLILQGTERKQQFEKINDFDLILTTYPLLPRDEQILLEHTYYYLILDEAQTIKNPQAKAAKLVRQLPSEHRLCLTGTPMENHLGELWAQFDFLMPGFLGDSSNFKKTYRTPIEMYGDQEKRKRLTRRIAPFMLRRTKQEVVKELPAKTEIIRAVPLLDEQAALYESIRLTMEKRVRDAIAQKGLSRSHITILDALLKLRQTCCDPRTLPLKEAQKITASAKLDLLMELLPELLEEGRRILVFSQFTRMIALIEQQLSNRKFNYAKLTGQTKNRDEAIELFKSGQVDIFLISLKAGGVGLNLTEADTVIIYDPWWNPAVENQAADRAHRIGQDKPVFIYKLITENTVEEKILAMQERKRLLANSIYQDQNQEESIQFTADDLTALLEPL